MGFILIMLVNRGGHHMGVWMLVSRYAKSADVEKIKERLFGIHQRQAGQGGRGQEPEQSSVMQVKQESSNRLAQLLVEKYQARAEDPCIFWSRPGCAGRRRGWCTCAWWRSGAECAVAWLMLPVPKIFSVLCRFR